MPCGGIFRSSHCPRIARGFSSRRRTRGLSAKSSTPNRFEQGRSVRTKEKGPSNAWALSDISLTMSYFHTGIRTIIGAEAFHCPVRDGKEWDHLAMVIRLNQSLSRYLEAANL